MHEVPTRVSRSCMNDIAQFRFEMIITVCTCKVLHCMLMVPMEARWRCIFAELGDNVKIEDIGEPQKVIDAFGPEITGQNVEGKVRNMDVKKYGGRTYYQYELDVPHMLVTATAAGNRLYLLSVTANGKLPCLRVCHYVHTPVQLCLPLLISFGFLWMSHRTSHLSVCLQVASGRNLHQI